MPKKKNIRKIFNSISFHIFIILLVCILPLNILFIASARRSTNALLNQAEYSINKIEAIYINDLDARIKITNNFLNEIIQNNSYCQTVFRQKGDSNYLLCKFLLAKKLINSSIEKTEGDIYFLYSPKLKDTLVIKRSGLDIDKVLVQNYILANISKSFYSDWQLVMINNKQYLIHSNYINKMYVGALICLDTFQRQIQKSIDYKTCSITFSAEPPTSPNKGTLTVMQSSSCSNLDLCCSIEKKEALQGLSFFQRFSSSIALFYLIIIPMLFMILGLILLRPLNIILHALTEIKKGNKDYRIKASHYAEEFQNINASFNRMADNIDKLTIENYEQQLARQQIELDNLQLTIRPHFLQNTFGILFTLCQMGKNERLGHFILYLSDYFRYIYQGVHQLASFDSELSIIKGYIEIAKVQHPDNFEISYEISTATNEIYVPPLLIHNFIENIISHALKHGSFLHILLQLDKEGENALFTISDDGIGMSEETVDFINQGKPIQDKKRTHVGLYNSWERLEKIYNGKAKMMLFSKQGMGTTIKIWIPMQNERREKNS